MQGAAADLLTPIRAVVLETDTVSDAEFRMIALGVSELYVIAPDGRLTGVLPDYEVLKRRLAGDIRVVRVADLMSPAGIAISRSTPLVEVAERMRLSWHRRLPVVDEGRLIGEVTRRSLLRHLQAADRVATRSQAPTGIVRAHAPIGPPKFLSTMRPLPATPARIAIET